MDRKQSTDVAESMVVVGEKWFSTVHAKAQKNTEGAKSMPLPE
jgi:hypothetical protein